MKLRKPGFKVQKSNDPKKRFAGRWKRPKGLQSKMREGRKGNPSGVEPGYGSPTAIRGATQEGLLPVVIRNVNELAAVKDGFGVVISAKVGLKRRAEIAREASVRSLKVINASLEGLTKMIADLMDARKVRRQKLAQKRASRRGGIAKQEKPKKAADDIEGKLDEEEKKRIEKSEKDKVLTKAQ
ncbi:TPA: hypothetical protein HA231_01410 [Candidatus Woesearchaeota archaeon]|nr:hypothetical protein [Candidatus Woesearchaeota archaeon]